MTGTVDGGSVDGDGDGASGVTDPDPAPLVVDAPTPVAGAALRPVGLPVLATAAVVTARGRIGSVVVTALKSGGTGVVTAGGDMGATVATVATVATAARSFGGLEAAGAGSEPADALDTLDPRSSAPASRARMAAAHRAELTPPDIDGMSDAVRRGPDEKECTNADHQDCRVI